MFEMTVNVEIQIKRKSLWEKLAMISSLTTGKMRQQKTFYYYFRPIAIVCRALGILPLSNLQDSSCKSLEFSYASVSSLYTMMLFVSCFAMMVCFFNFKSFTKYMPKADDAFLWRCIILLAMIVKACIYFCLCFIRSKKFIKLIRLLDLFDDRKFGILKAQHESIEDNARHFFKWTVKPLLVGCIATILVAVDLYTFARSTLTQARYVELYSTIYYTMFGILGIWQMIPLYLFVHFADVTKEKFKDINHIFWEIVPIKKIYVKSEEQQPPSNMKDAIRNIRLLFVLMSDVVNTLNSSFGAFLAVDQFCVILAFVVNLYVFFFTDNEDISLLYFVVINGSVIVVMVLVSHDVNREAHGVFDVIEHKFLISGHSFMACDRDFAHIEKRKGVMKAMIPEDLNNVIKSAVYYPPFEIVDMEKHGFWNIKEAAEALIDIKNLNIIKAVMLRVERENPCTVKVRETFSEFEPWRDVNVLEKSKSILDVKSTNLLLLPPDNKITDNKKNH